MLCLDEKLACGIAGNAPEMPLPAKKEYRRCRRRNDGNRRRVGPLKSREMGTFAGFTGCGKNSECMAKGRNLRDGKQSVKPRGSFLGHPGAIHFSPLPRNLVFPQPSQATAQATRQVGFSPHPMPKTGRSRWYDRRVLASVTSSRKVKAQEWTWIVPLSSSAPGMWAW